MIKENDGEGKGGKVGVALSLYTQTYRGGVQFLGDRQSTPLFPNAEKFTTIKSKTELNKWNLYYDYRLLAESHVPTKHTNKQHSFTRKQGRLKTLPATQNASRKSPVGQE